MREDERERDREEREVAVGLGPSRSGRRDGLGGLRGWLGCGGRMGLVRPAWAELLSASLFS